MSKWFWSCCVGLSLGCSSSPADDTDTDVDTDLPGDTDDTADTDLPAPELCSDENPVGFPFSPGGSGYGIGDLVQDFTLPTTEGDWTFSDNWTGCDSYVFITYQQGWEYGDLLWDSLSRDFFQGRPDNVHYFILTYPTDSASVDAEIASVQAIMNTRLDELKKSKKNHWEPRIHYVNVGATTMTNIISDKFIDYSGFGFAIDRHQRFRAFGGLYDHGFNLDMDALPNETEHYNFEWERNRALGAQEGVTEILLLEEVSVGGRYDIQVDLPDAATMATFDTLEIDMTSACDEDPLNFACGEWDYNGGLYICDADDPTICDTIFGRWVTTYGRAGRWVWDVSPMMGLIAEGGTRTFQLHNPNTYTTTLSFRFRNTGKGTRPVGAQYLWSGGSFNESYNENHPPLEVSIPADATRVELVIDVTGHGFGTEKANCAEFCNHEHEFTINDSAVYIKDHPETKNTDGCRDQIAVGTVPNQYGTWWYGRGGWCPGMEVAVWSVDISNDVTVGQTNTIAYRGLLKGEDYIPEPSGSSSGFGANIYLNSWLVYYQ
jgi:hypothetical protein